MAPRANWKGYLKLSLVSCPVALFPATSSSSRIAFNTLNQKIGSRVKRLYADAETGEPVESEDQVKGYAVGKGAYVFVEDEELEAIRIESTHTINIERFVPRDQVDPRFLEAPYYIAPDDKVGQEAFAVIRDAMRDKNKAGLGRVVIARRERIVLIEPLAKGILATVLRYRSEVRGEDAYFEDLPDVELPAEMRDLAGHIIETKSGDFDPSTFEDRYETAVIALIKSQAGVAVAEVPAPRPSNVVNLMEALRRSIAAEKAAEPPTKAPSKTSAERAAAKVAAPKKAAAKKAAAEKTTAPASAGSNRPGRPA